MSPAATHSTPVRERVLATASDLFYRQGYHATGINQIIAESGVAKASFYDHFPSKEALLQTYLRYMVEKEIAEMEEVVWALPTPEERFFGPLGVLIPWFTCTDFRGCPFQNILSEAPFDDPVVRELAQSHRENVRGLLAKVSKDLVQARPDLADMDPQEIANLYLIMVEGAIAVAVAYRATWPVEAVEQHLKDWLHL